MGLLSETGLFPSVVLWSTSIEMDSHSASFQNGDFFSGNGIYGHNIGNNVISIWWLLKGAQDPMYKQHIASYSYQLLAHSWRMGSFVPWIFVNRTWTVFGSHWIVKLTEKASNGRFPHQHLANDIHFLRDCES